MSKVLQKTWNKTILQMSTGKSKVNGKPVFKLSSCLPPRHFLTDIFPSNMSAFFSNSVLGVGEGSHVTKKAPSQLTA